MRRRNQQYVALAPRQPPPVEEFLASQDLQGLQVLFAEDDETLKFGMVTFQMAVELESRPAVSMTDFNAENVMEEIIFKWCEDGTNIPRNIIKNILIASAAPIHREYLTRTDVNVSILCGAENTSWIEMLRRRVRRNSYLQRPCKTHTGQDMNFSAKIFRLFPVAYFLDTEPEEVSMLQHKTEE